MRTKIDTVKVEMSFADMEGLKADLESLIREYAEEVDRSGGYDFEKSIFAGRPRLLLLLKALSVEYINPQLPF